MIIAGVDEIGCSWHDSGGANKLVNVVFKELLPPLRVLAWFTTMGSLSPWGTA